MAFAFMPSAVSSYLMSSQSSSLLSLNMGVSLDVSLIGSGIRSTKPSSCTWDEVLYTPALPFFSTLSVVLGFAAGDRV
jgi:hypothetical protein